MERFAKAGDFCPNEACPEYGKLHDGQAQQIIIKTGHTKKGVQRYQCKTCGKTFTETTGTLFFRKRTPEHEILETLVLLAEGSHLGRQLLQSGATSQELAIVCPGGCLPKMVTPNARHDCQAGRSYLDY